MSDRRHRLFVALEVPHAVRERLHGLALELAHLEPGLRPVPIQRIHATVLFIGAAETSTLERLAPTLFDAMHGPPIPSELGAIVPRPRQRSARLVAAEYADVEGRVAQLAERLAGIVGDAGGPARETGRFWPHITIARFSRPTRLRRYATSGGEHVFAFDRITLYDSFITSGGSPRYQALMTIPLDSHRERKSQHG